MLRLTILLLAFLPIVLTAQVIATNHFGSVEVTTSLQAIEVRRAAREWRIDMQRLPVRPNDCVSEPARQQCRALPAGSPCTECIVRPWVIAWDEPHRRLYFAVSTTRAQNVPWIVFRYDLRTRRASRVVNDYGGGFSRGQISRSGQYLAYVQYDVLGACGTSGSLVVVDSWARRSGNVEYETATQNEIPVVKAFRWISPAEIQYEAEVHKDSECREGDNYPKQKIQATVNVNEIEFR